MRFGSKLALFLIATLLIIQAVTGFATYALIRQTLIADRMQRLTVAAGQFTRQLAEVNQQLATSVRVLTLDFALRTAIADHDHATVVSALNNHGRRVGASRMLLVELDRSISADTAPPPGEGGLFAYPSLLAQAMVEGSVATVVVEDGKPVWLVVVPVLAPVPIAFVVTALPLDDGLLARMRSLSGLPPATGLAIAGDDGWRVAAGPIDAELVRTLPRGAGLQPQPSIIQQAQGETIVLASYLHTAPGAPLVAAVMEFPLSEALAPYRGLILVVVLGLTIGLVAAIAGAWFISRGVARPLEMLARHTRKIAAGEYAAPPVTDRHDEIGELSQALGSMTQAIAERESRIRHQATHDPVTLLPNRTSLSEAIDRALPCAAAVFVVELVRLREVANTVGRDLADRVMRDAAARMTALCEAAPAGCVGEQSLACLLPCPDAATAEEIAAPMIAAFDQPYREGDFTIDLNAAIGVALAPGHGTTAAALLRRAEVAAHLARQRQPRAAVYQADTDPHRPELLSLMSELRRGLQTGELQLLFQPKLSLSERRITGGEALVRWQHPTRGAIPPDAFIPLAEETGNIRHLTDWALQSGIARAAAWFRAGTPLRISINLSARDLAGSTLPDRVAALLAEYRLPPAWLALEITESAIMTDPDAAVAVLHRLAAQGIALVVDDFGIGQSSLAYLRRLPVTELKIDKSFVLTLPDRADDQAIVRSVVELAHRIGCRVTAEGVEDAATIDLLAAFGCDEAQGYAVSRPLPAEAFAAFAAAWRPEHAEARTAS